LPISQHVCWHVFLSTQSSLLLQTSSLFFLIHFTLSAQLSPFLVHFLVAASSHGGSMVGVDVGAAVAVAVGAGVGFGAASARKTRTWPASAPPSSFLGEPTAT